MRRVRGEALDTKIVILSGTADDEIIRELVRAGGDAYGPSLRVYRQGSRELMSLGQSRNLESARREPRASLGARTKRSASIRANGRAVDDPRRLRGRPRAKQKIQAAEQYAKHKDYASVLIARTRSTRALRLWTNCPGIDGDLTSAGIKGKIGSGHHLIVRMWRNWQTR